MSLSIHLFKLAKLNSEIKYVANSIVREAPPYAYPPITDIYAWQRGMLEQLDHWVSTIPQSQPRHAYIRTLSEIRYYTIKILLLRPSPAISRPSTEALVECYGLAWRAIQLYDQLYRQDMLVHDWVALHGIVFSTITALYCIRAVPDLARRTELDELMSHLSLSLSLVSVAGERWAGAKRSRQILDDIGRSTIKWMKALKTSVDPNISDTTTLNERTQVPPTPNIGEHTLSMNTPSGDIFPGYNHNIGPTPGVPSGLSLEDRFWANPPQQFDFGDFTNVDNIMHSLFQDFVPPINQMYY